MADVNSDTEIIEFAIARELEAYHFFLALAEKVASTHIRAVLHDLANEELEHKEKLRLELMKMGKVVPDTPKTTIPPHDYVISDTDEQLNMDYRDVLLLGMEKEEASFRTYVSLIPRVHDEGSREVLLALAEEEVRHKLRFQTEYDALLRQH
jgi:rubrerythrin